MTRKLEFTLILALFCGCNATTAPAPVAAPTPPQNTAPVSGITSGPINGNPNPGGTAPAYEDIQAKVGVGIKGRSLDQYEGVVVTPAKSLFAVKERVVFEIQIPQALGLYKAQEGNAPKTHEEFMTAIVQANNLRLPELPQGHTYVWDPESEQLMVRRPKATQP